MPARPERQPPLDRDQIVGAALELADADGVDSLSMRNLATHLGCGAMSLYNHVANKDALLAHLVEAVATEVVDPPAGTPPLAAVRAVAVSTRAMFVAHPWAVELWQRHLPGPARTRLMEELLRHLDESELSPELAHHGFHAVLNHVLGYTLQERGLTMGHDDPEATARTYLTDIEGDFPRMAGHVRQHLHGETGPSFELVLDLILDGLVRLEREARP